MLAEIREKHRKNVFVKFIKEEESPPDPDPLDKLLGSLIMYKPEETPTPVRRQV